MRYFEELNKQDWCYLTNISEPSDNQLVLEVTPSFTSNAEEEISVGDKTLKGRRMTPDKNGPRFQLYFHNYVAYQVINESFPDSDEGELLKKGDRWTFVVFTKSNYLDFILKETIAGFILPIDEIRHYRLYTQNHIVHVIAADEPEIELVNKN